MRKRYEALLVCVCVSCVILVEAIEGNRRGRLHNHLSQALSPAQFASGAGVGTNGVDGRALERLFRPPPMPNLQQEWEAAKEEV